MKHVEPAGRRFRDHLDTKVSDWIIPYQSNVEFDAALIGVPLSKTSISHSAAFRLPDAIRSVFQAWTPFSAHHELDLAAVLRLVDLGNIQMHLTDLMRCLSNIEESVQSYFASSKKPLVLMGGDHSITGAAVLGLTKALGQRIGIIHFDAHHDVRNFEDGGRSNGTPFRTILESGLVRGEDIVQLGIKDFSNAKPYYDYVRGAGVEVFTARTVHQVGLKALVKRAYETISAKTDLVYVSFDMDVLDQSFAPGVPAPTPGGLTIWDAIETVEWLGQQKQVIGFDTVCVDPSQDFRDLTVRSTAMLVMSFLTGLALRCEGERV